MSRNTFFFQKDSRNKKYNKSFHYYIIYSCFYFFPGLFIMVSLFVFGFKVAEEIEERHIQEWFLSWSFSLACTSLLLNQISASILITENKRLYTEQNEAQKSQVDCSNSFSGEDDNELIETDNQSSYNQDNLNCVLITK